MNASTKRILSASSLLLVASSLTAACSVDTESRQKDQALTSFDLSAAVTITEEWPTGYCATVRIENEGDAAVSPWNAEVAISAETVTNVWEGSGELSDGVLVVSPAAHNSHLEPGQTANFGYCAEAKSGDPEVLSVSGTVAGGAQEGVGTVLEVFTEWGSGYCANIVATNDTDGTTSTWGATVDLKGGALVNSWNATSQEEEGVVTFGPQSYNAVLSPGASTMFGFCASKGESGELPVIIEEPDEPTECGDGTICGEGSYCLTELGSCGTGPGVCFAAPEVCSQEYNPVCGCDGNTYANACEAAAASVNVEYEGQCDGGAVGGAGGSL